MSFTKQTTQFTIVDNFGWVDQAQTVNKGRYRDESGNGLFGMYRKDTKNRSTVYVLYNGNVVTKYTFRNVSVPFVSSLVSWKNLNYCGGWHFTDVNSANLTGNEPILNAVANGTKPIGFILPTSEEADYFIDQARELGLKYKAFPRSDEDRVEIALTRLSGKVERHFDIENLIESYKMLVDLNDIGVDSKDLREFGLRDIEEFILGEWDYANPKTAFDLIPTGLLLGYAIESTAACILDER